MKIILHADDFGFDIDTYNATVDCFERGALTSASIMVTAPAAHLALDYARKHPQFSFGVHLTYVDRLIPASFPASIGRMVNADGLFLLAEKIRRRAMLLSIPSNQIIEETMRQIHMALDAGISVSHVDSHGHIHKFPAFQWALHKIRNQIPDGRVRRVQNLFIARQGRSFVRESLNTLFDRAICSTFKTSDYFYMPANSLDIHWSDNILQQIGMLQADQSLEIGVHPGHEEPWRQHEYQDILCFSEKLKNTEHTLINWADL